MLEISWTFGSPRPHWTCGMKPEIIRLDWKLEGNRCSPSINMASSVSRYFSWQRSCTIMFASPIFSLCLSYTRVIWHCAGQLNTQRDPWVLWIGLPWAGVQQWDKKSLMMVNPSLILDCFRACFLEYVSKLCFISHFKDLHYVMTSTAAVM